MDKNLNTMDYSKTTVHVQCYVLVLKSNVLSINITSLKDVLVVHLIYIYNTMLLSCGELMLMVASTMIGSAGVVYCFMPR